MISNGSQNLNGKLLVPYRSPQQYFTEALSLTGENKNGSSHYVIGVTGDIERKKNATVKHDIRCRCFQLPEQLSINAGPNITNAYLADQKRSKNYQPIAMMRPLQVIFHRWSRLMIIHAGADRYVREDVNLFEAYHQKRSLESSRHPGGGSV
jgi:hypothetical protein